MVTGPFSFFCVWFVFVYFSCCNTDSISIVADSPPVAVCTVCKLADVSSCVCTVCKLADVSSCVCTVCTLADVSSCVCTVCTLADVSSCVCTVYKLADVSISVCAMGTGPPLILTVLKAHSHVALRFEPGRKLAFLATHVSHGSPRSVF